MSSSSSSTSLAACPVTDWSYIAEGGANLVVAYSKHSSSSSEWSDTVLRIRKRRNASQTDNANDGQSAPSSSGDRQVEEDASVAFTDRVVIPLLPPQSTPELTSIPVPASWLMDMSDHIQQSRPESRRAVDSIDIHRGYVVRAENLVGTVDQQQLSIEIKPKWGFLPRPTYLSAETKDIKTTHCRFCLHQIHREQLRQQPDSKADPGDSAQQAHSRATKYCPLDLYSQDAMRVETALRALVRSWADHGGKGNNLKVFWRGRTIGPQEMPPVPLLGQDYENTLVKILTPALAASKLVKRLSQLQASLDPLDIEGLRSLLMDREGIDIAKMDDSTVSKLGGEVSISEYAQFVQHYSHALSLSRSQPAPADGHSGTLSDSWPSEDSPTRDLIIAYLLSATFKDCSLFASIRTLPNATASAGSNDIDIQVVDCDVKSVDRLKKWYDLDQDIVHSFVKAQFAGLKPARCRQ